MFVALSHSRVAQTYLRPALRFHDWFQLQCTLSEAAWQTRSQARGWQGGMKKRDKEPLVNLNLEGHESSKQDLNCPSVCLSSGLLEGLGQNMKISVYPEGSAEKLNLFI